MELSCPPQYFETWNGKLVTHTRCKWLLDLYHNVLQVTTLTVWRMKDVWCLNFLNVRSLLLKYFIHIFISLSACNWSAALLRELFRPWICVTKLNARSLALEERPIEIDSDSQAWISLHCFHHGLQGEQNEDGRVISYCYIADALPWLVSSVVYYKGGYISRKVQGKLLSPFNSIHSESLIK